MSKCVQGTRGQIWIPTSPRWTLDCSSINSTVQCLMRSSPTGRMCPNRMLSATEPSMRPIEISQGSVLSRLHGRGRKMFSRASNALRVWKRTKWKTSTSLKKGLTYVSEVGWFRPLLTLFSIGFRLSGSISTNQIDQVGYSIRYALTQ